jgi:hypothetical protein
MLGHVCRNEFYTLQNDYQESFVIHIQHPIVTLFYAKLPNDYLSKISHHGAKYATMFPQDAKIHLCRSRPFVITNSNDQAHFYLLITKLLYFLAGGHSHVGYLSNHPTNPLLTEVVFLFISATDDSRRWIRKIWFHSRSWSVGTRHVIISQSSNSLLLLS